MVPDQLEDFTDKKLYLHATEKLCHSHELLCTDLKDVHALKDIAYSLNNWKEVSLAKYECFSTSFLLILTTNVCLFVVLRC